MQISIPKWSYLNRLQVHSTILYANFNPKMVLFECSLITSSMLSLCISIPKWSYLNITFSFLLSCTFLFQSQNGLIWILVKPFLNLPVTTFQSQNGLIWMQWSWQYFLKFRYFNPKMVLFESGYLGQRNSSNWFQSQNGLIWIISPISNSINKTSFQSQNGLIWIFSNDLLLLLLTHFNPKMVLFECNTPPTIVHISFISIPKWSYLNFDYWERCYWCY